MHPSKNILCISTLNNSPKIYSIYTEHKHLLTIQLFCASFFFPLNIYQTVPYLHTYWSHSFFWSHDIPLCGCIMLYLAKPLSVNINGIWHILYIYIISQIYK